MTKIKMSRQARLAYLCHIAHERMLKGNSTRSNWYRHYQLTVALDKEVQFNTINTTRRAS